MSLDPDVWRELGLWPQWRLRREASPASGPVEMAGEPAERIEGHGEGLSVHLVAEEPSAVVAEVFPSAVLAPEEAWRALREEVAACRLCSLCETRTQTVFGVGDPAADWLVVGEAPGADEDRLGDPFVGQAGKLLDNMLAAIDLQRGENVYIANVLKCRPPGNRNPDAAEMARCVPYLTRQIDLIQPKLILALGRFAVQFLLETTESIARLRGRVHRFRDTPVVVTYHPAYLLRNLPDKAKSWEDLCLARRVMADLAGE